MHRSLLVGFLTCVPDIYGKMNSHATTTLLALAFLIITVIGQVVSPFATHDCSDETVYTGDYQCNNNPTTCCAYSGTCCAGGCCPYNAICVFEWTANEACCSLSDSTLCGSAQPVSSPLNWSPELHFSLWLSSPQELCCASLGLKNEYQTLS